MEELLMKFMEQMNYRFDGLENRMDGLENQIGGLENRLDGLENRIGGLENRIGGLENQIGGVENRISNLENEVSSLKGEQSEMRKEVAFYYGSLMKEHENTRTEMRSSIRHVDDSIKQHQNFIEMLDIRTNNLQK